jgi:hypothetical protein
MKKNVRKNAGMLLMMASLCGAGTAFAQAPDLLVCSSRGYTLTSVANASGTSAVTYLWYENDSPVPDANDATLSITAESKEPGVYQYVRKASSAECNDISSNAFTVQVVAQPSVPTVNATTAAVCEGANVIFAVAAPFTGATYTWTGDPGMPSGTGDATYILTSPATGTRSVQATASVFYTASAGTKTKTCTSTESTVASAVVNPLPVVTPTGTFAHCGSDEFPLSVTVAAGGTDVTGTSTITWYAENSTSSTQVATGANYSPNLTVSDTYYVGAVVNATSCPSASLTPVIATIDLYEGEIFGEEN